MGSSVFNAHDISIYECCIAIPPLPTERSEFGVDDRPEVERSSEGDQSTLFADTDADQQTLAGEQAAGQCLFGDGEGDDNSDRGNRRWQPHSYPFPTSH